jgi:hypothetical protein
VQRNHRRLQLRKKRTCDQTENTNQTRTRATPFRAANALLVLSSNRHANRMSDITIEEETFVLYLFRCFERRRDKRIKVWLAAAIQSIVNFNQFRNPAEIFVTFPERRYYNKRSCKSPTTTTKHTKTKTWRGPSSGRDRECRRMPRTAPRATLIERVSIECVLMSAEVRRTDERVGC